MKKVVIIIILLCVLLVGISPLIKTKLFNKIDDNKEGEEVIKEEEEDTYIDDNKIILGLYKDYHNGKERVLIKEYESNFEYHKDISSFEVYYTNEESISNESQIKLFDRYKDNYENVLDYRIGYKVSFNTVDGTVSKTVLSPKDTNDFYNILEVYLYDDYHRNGGWYSHTTEEEFNKDTLLTSIKLTAGKEVDKITSDITLEAFTYMEEDLDELGNYKGNSKYLITIKKSS